MFYSHAVSFLNINYKHRAYSFFIDRMTAKSFCVKAILSNMLALICSLLSLYEGIISVYEVTGWCAVSLECLWPENCSCKFLYLDLTVILCYKKLLYIIDPNGKVYVIEPTKKIQSKRKRKCDLDERHKAT